MDTAKKVAIVAGVGSAVAVASTVAVPAVLGLAGFGASGVSAGSCAAGMMSAAWKAGQGIWIISALQSAGAAGVGIKTAAVSGAVAAKVADSVIRK